jgi:hypothetical protein
MACWSLVLVTDILWLHKGSQQLLLMPFCPSVFVQNPNGPEDTTPKL